MASTSIVRRKSVLTSNDIHAGPMVRRERDPFHNRTGLLPAGSTNDENGGSTPGRENHGYRRVYAAQRIDLKRAFARRAEPDPHKKSGAGLAAVAPIRINPEEFSAPLRPRAPPSPPRRPRPRAPPSG